MPMLSDGTMPVFIRFLRFVGVADGIYVAIELPGNGRRHIKYILPTHL